MVWTNPTLAPWLSILAYLDPGSGSVLIQLLIAGLFGALFMLKVYWGKVKAFFSRKPSNPEDQPKHE